MRITVEKTEWEFSTGESGNREVRCVVHRGVHYSPVFFCE